MLPLVQSSPSSWHIVASNPTYHITHKKPVRRISIDLSVGELSKFRISHLMWQRRANQRPTLADEGICSLVFTRQKGPIGQLLECLDYSLHIFSRLPCISAFHPTFACWPLFIHGYKTHGSHIDRSSCLLSFSTAPIENNKTKAILHSARETINTSNDRRRKADIG